MSKHTPSLTQPQLPFGDIGPNPSGLCMCGCGKPAPIAKMNDKRRGWIKGQPVRFIHNHHGEMQHGSLAERFWAKVDKRGPDDCWLWHGKKGRFNGYGAISSGNKRCYTHRISWELHFGPIPDGLFVLHKCDVRLCCNPTHLFLGTSQDNIADMIAKGRRVDAQPKGEASGMAKLTEDDVREIRRQHAQGELSGNIGTRFGIDRTTVWKIVRRKAWKHIE